VVFKRRDRLPFWNRVRETLAPKKGWRRGIHYLSKRMQRLPDTPHKIALGFACGVQTSFTPLFGFHFVVAAALAFITRGNILASAIGTFWGNPVTFPFIAAASLFLGARITGIDLHPHAEGATFGWLWDNADAIFWPYLIGGLAPGLISAIISYWIVRPVVAAYQMRRRLRLMARAKIRLRQHAEAKRAKAEAKTRAHEEEGVAARAAAARGPSG